jgi:hypothetical protein
MWICAIFTASFILFDCPFLLAETKHPSSDGYMPPEHKRQKSNGEVGTEPKRTKSVEEARDEGKSQIADVGTRADATSPKSEEDVRKEAEESKRLRDLFLRNQSVFIRKGELMLEVNTFYNVDTQTDLVPAGAGAAVVKTTRRFFDTTLIARYGLLVDGLELDIFAPVFVYAQQENDFGVVRNSIVEEGFGDVRAALRYQVWYERGIRPSVIVDVEGKSRTGGSGLTGTGNWNAGGGITLLKTLDPVVIFGRVGYTYTFGSEVADLGNAIDYRIGLGFSLNDKVSFTMQVTGAYIGSSKVTTVDPSGVAGQILLRGRTLEIANFLFTTTVLITDSLFIEPVVGIGITDQAFDGIFGIRLPYRF